MESRLETRDTRRCKFEMLVLSTLASERYTSTQYIMTYEYKIYFAPITMIFEFRICDLSHT